MTSKAEDTSRTTCPTVGWKDGAVGILAGIIAGLCCGGPLLFSVLGFAGIAGFLSSMSLVYHVILQWVALAIIAGSWSWFVWKISQLPHDQRWNQATIVTGVILIAVSLYVIKSWANHIFV